MKENPGFCLLDGYKYTQVCETKLGMHRYTAPQGKYVPTTVCKREGECLGFLPLIPSQDSEGHCEMKMWILHSAGGN